MKPETEILRGFGFVFEGGAVRNWYQGKDGVKRWANNDEPVGLPSDIATPNGLAELEANEGICAQESDRD